VAFAFTIGSGTTVDESIMSDLLEYDGSGSNVLYLCALCAFSECQVF
jgi:hypothetical protein